MLHNALIKHSNDNFRCRVFALLIGSVDPHSYLNRVEATDFFLRTVMAIFDINENDIKLSSVDNNEYLIKGNRINKIDILFKKIEKNND